MFADIKSLQAFHYSKCQKCLKEISKFWKSQAEAYNKRSNEGADMDSQDEHNHGILTLWCTRKNKVGVNM